MNEQVLSSFEGSRALIDITENEKWHKLLDINSSDLGKLRDLRSGKEIDELIRKAGPKNERELDRILSKAQRAAIVQGLQRSRLVDDMKVLLSNEVVN